MADCSPNRDFFLSFRIEDYEISITRFFFVFFSSSFSYKVEKLYLSHLIINHKICQ